MSQADDKISGLYHEADEAVPSKTLDDTILSASRKPVKNRRTRARFQQAGLPPCRSLPSSSSL